jgi:protein-disulfide isomerase
MTPVRLAAIALSVAALAVAACSATAKPGPDLSQDRAMGSAKAPVTMIEYASVTCPYCAAWNSNVFPEFKKKYIDTGKVRYVFRETLIHDEVDVVGFRVARCASPDKYFQVIDAMMRGLPQMKTEPPRTVFLAAAKSAGMSEADVDRCLADKPAMQQAFLRQDKEAKEFDIEGTPTFIVDGKKAEEGDASLAELSAVIDPLLQRSR